MNLAGAFAAAVRTHQQKTALFWGEREYSYDELWAQSAFVSKQLQERLGVKAGDRVALWLKNCPEFVPALFGIFHSGAVAVPINNFLKPDEVSYILNDAEIDVLLTDAELGAHFKPLKTARPTLELFVVQDHSSPTGFAGATNGKQHIARDEEWERQPALDTSFITESDLAVLIYTSGTTGRPKGAMLSHGNLLHNVESCRIVLQTVAADRFALMMPKVHSFMLLVGVLLPFVVGGSIVLIQVRHPGRT